MIYLRNNDAAAAMSAFETALAVKPARTLEHIFTSKIYQQLLYILPDKTAPLDGLKKGYENAAQAHFRLKNPSARFPQDDTLKTPEDHEPKVY
jgi:hypothetical protein